MTPSLRKKEKEFIKEDESKATRERGFAQKIAISFDFQGKDVEISETINTRE